MIGQNLHPDDVVDRLAQIFERWGAQVYLGEPVTVAEHMLQCAALAEAEGASDTLVAAALLHDIGHFRGGFDAVDQDPDDAMDRRHDALGAAELEPYFPLAITEPIRLHVAAKRYLCAADSDYHETLSAASKHSLVLQGGPMSPAEVADFRSLPFHEDAVRLRLWDDGGKNTERGAPCFDDFRPLLLAVLR